ncbi:hypothetical protein FKP32DRAFT_1679456 [Trametes sanguinea]|nr:hypothetical protein FKP32DRAFT_1679456 [Trametes sanguinea]
MHYGNNLFQLGPPNSVPVEDRVDPPGMEIVRLNADTSPNPLGPRTPLFRGRADQRDQRDLQRPSDRASRSQARRARDLKARAPAPSATEQDAPVADWSDGPWSPVSPGARDLACFFL